MLAKAAEAQAGAEKLAAIVEAARAEVVAAFEAVRERQVSAATEKMSIEAIKDVTDGRLRLDELPAHGYFTVADVLRAGPDRLTGVPGIGEGTAAKVVGAAEQLQQAVRDSLQFRIELDPTDAETTRLLQALAVWGAVRHAGETYEAGRRPARPGAGRRTARSRRRRRPGRVRRLFMAARRRRARGRGGATGRRTAAGRPSRAACCARARTSERSRCPAPAEVWRDFERRSAAYYGLLGQVVALGGDVAAAEGYLPADIVERVNAQRLDTSRLSDSLRLRGYQSFGARFALVQRRVILGDEMGLGKTVQAIAAMAHLAANGATHFLVVCPASVLINWTREVAQHSTLPVVALHGGDRARAAGPLAAPGRRRGDHVRLARHPRPDAAEAGPARRRRGPLREEPERQTVAGRQPDRRRLASGCCSSPVRRWRTGSTSSRPWSGHLRPEIAADAWAAQHGVLGVEAFRARRGPGLPAAQPAGRAHRAARARAGRRVGGVRRRGRRGVPRRRCARATSWPCAGPRSRSASPRDSAKLTRLLEIAREAMANGRKVVVFSYFRDVLDVVGRALGPRARGPDHRLDVDRRTPAHRGRLHRLRRPGGARLPDRGRRRRPQHPGRLGRDPVRAAGQAVHRGAGGGPRAPDGTGPLGPGAPAPDRRLRRPADARAARFQGPALRRVRAAQRDRARPRPGAVDISEVQLARTIVAQEQRRLATAAGDRPLPRAALGR